MDRHAETKSSPTGRTSAGSAAKSGSRPAPGRVSRTGSLSAGAAVVQRKADGHAATGAGGAVKSAGDWTHDPQMDAAVRGVAPASGGGSEGAVVQRQEAERGQEEVALEESTQEQEGEAPELKPEGTTKKKFLDQAASQKVLQDAFGTYKTINKGKVSALAQAEFQKAYDKIYGTTQYAWDKYIKPKFGNLEGFAHGGVNYINTAMASIDTVVHEMLHSNDAADWVGVVGSEFNEGTTEYMTIHAMKKAGKSHSQSYPDQEGVVSTVVKNGLSEAHLFTAYLKGGAKKLVADWVDNNCKGTWAEVKTAMQAQSWATAKTKVAKK